MEMTYWIEIFGINRNKVEVLYSKQEKLLNSINEKLQVLSLPMFGAFESLKESTKIIAQVEDFHYSGPIST